MKVFPIKPDNVRPKKENTEKQAENKVVQQKKILDIQPPDISKQVKKINDRLAGEWEHHEIRCGRSFNLGIEFNLNEITEIYKAFKTTGWNINISKERRGVILSFKPPEEESVRSNQRGKGGNL